MNKNELVIVADYAKDTSLTLAELCQLCHITPDFIQELIQEDIIFPLGGEEPPTWHFTITHLRQVKTVTRLQRDLEMNLPSIAIVMDLLNQITELQNRMSIVERHLLK